MAVATPNPRLRDANVRAAAAGRTGPARVLPAAVAPTPAATPTPGASPTAPPPLPQVPPGRFPRVEVP